MRLWISVLCTYITDSEWIHPDSVRGKTLMNCLMNPWTRDVCDIVGISVQRFREFILARLVETKRKYPQVLHVHRSMRKYDYFMLILGIGLLLSKGYYHGFLGAPLV